MACFFWYVQCVNNEFLISRKVFDMLMSTAVKDQTAQYFLLTPKLLPNLTYQVKN